MLLSPGCSVLRNQDWLLGWEGQVPASDAFPWTGIYCAGSAGSILCLSFSLLSSQCCSWKAQDSVTPTCHQPPHAALVPGSWVRSFRAASTAQGCLTSIPAPLPGTAMDLCTPGQVCPGARTDVAQTAVRLHIPFNLWLGVINPPTKHPGSPVSVTLGEWSSFPGDQLVIDAAAAKSQQGWHSAHPGCRNSAFVLLLSLSTSTLQGFCFCAASATQHIPFCRNSASVLVLCY